MGDKSLIEIRKQNAVPEEEPNTAPSIIDVFSNSASNKQALEREKLNAALNGRAINHPAYESNKSYSTFNKNIRAALDFMFQQQSQQYQAAFRPFIKMADHARDDYKDFGNTIDDHAQKYEAYKAEMYESTLTLDDGTKVFKKGQNYKVRKNGVWEELDGDLLIEAKEKEQALIASGKQPATTDQAEALWAYKAGIAHAGQMQQDNLQKIDQLQEKVMTGNADPKQNKKYEQDTQEMQKQIYPTEQGLEELEQKIKKMNDTQTILKDGPKTSIQPKEERNNDFEDYTASPFRNSSLTANKAIGISSADPEIETDVQLSGDFKIASNGDIKTLEQQPAIDPKDPSMSTPSL